MSSRSDQDFLRDILEATRRAMQYVAGMAYEQFLADTKTQDAVVRNLEIMGEATKRPSPEVCASHPKVPWRYMAGMRDKLIHDYFGVNLDIVWQIVSEELPFVVRQVETLLDD